MALNPLVNVSVSLQAGSVSRAGFGLPLFATKHRYFPERARSYSSLLSAEDDIPTGSNSYKGLQGYFAQNPTVTSAYLGRIESDQVLTPVGVDDGSTHSITVVISTGDAVTASYTAADLDTAEDVVTALKTAIDADPDVSAEVTTTVNGTGSDATLTIAATDASAGDLFYTPIDDIVGLDDTYTSTEVAADVISNIRLENDDWYFFSAEDHSQTFVTEAAAAIEATSKLYFVSTSEADSLAVLPSTPTDTAGLLQDSNYSRTAHLWHQDADTDFPETRFVGRNAPFDAGSVTWANIQLAGVSASRSASGNLLTQTQKNNLETRNSNFIEDYRTLGIVRLGRVSSGEYIDTMRGLDWQTEEITVSMSNLLVNQAGGKVQGNDVGINRIESTLSSALQRGVNRNFIEGDFTVTVPAQSERSAADISDRILRDVTFTATLTGAIHDVEIVGTLSQ